MKKGNFGRAMEVTNAAEKNAREDYHMAYRPRKAYHTDMARKRILFIDDEELIREIMYDMLTDMNYEVLVEETGEEAVKTFAKRPGAFDLVLTDLMMDDMRGDEIAERVLSIRPDMPVIVMTGTPGNLPPDRAKTLGIFKVLGKPFTRAELRQELREALSHGR